MSRKHVVIIAYPALEPKYVYNAHLDSINDGWIPALKSDAYPEVP